MLSSVQTCRGHALALLLLPGGMRWRGNKGRTGAGKGEGYGPVIRILNCVASVHGVHSVHCTAAGR